MWHSTHSSGCVAISRGDRASCLGCGCHRPHMPGSGAACPGLRCPARSQGRLLSLYRLEARIIVVDPGFMVDPGYPRAPDPPRSPDPPRKPENPSAWRGGSGSCGGCDVQGRGRGDHALTVARWLTGGQAGPLHTAGVLPSAWPVCGKAGWPRLPAPARSQESRRERGLDHQTTRWTGRTIGGFIKDASFGQNVTFIGLAARLRDQGERGEEQRVNEGLVASNAVSGLGSGRCRRCGTCRRDRSDGRGPGSLAAARSGRAGSRG